MGEPEKRRRKNEIPSTVRRITHQAGVSHLSRVKRSLSTPRSAEKSQVVTSRGTYFPLHFAGKEGVGCGLRPRTMAAIREL